MRTVAESMYAENEAEGSPYHIPVLLQSIRIMTELEEKQNGLVLQSIHENLSIPKSTAFRILKTLVHRGYVTRMPSGAYKSSVYSARKRHIAVLSSHLDDGLRISLTQAAISAGISLTFIRFAAHQQDESAIVTQIIRRRVDIIVLLRCTPEGTFRIADLLAQARIPTVAIDTPQPHAYFLGVDDYRLGREAGKLLASCLMGSCQYTARILGLDGRSADQSVHPRLLGAWSELRATLAGLPGDRLSRIPGCHAVEPTRYILSKLLDDTLDRDSIIIFAATEQATEAAAAFVRENPQLENLLVIGVGAPETVFRNFDRPAALVGLAYPRISDYGPELMELSLRCLDGSPIQPYNYVSLQTVSYPRPAESKRRIVSSVPKPLLSSGDTMSKSIYGQKQLRIA